MRSGLSCHRGISTIWSYLPNRRPNHYYGEWGVQYRGLHAKWAVVSPSGTIVADQLPTREAAVVAMRGAVMATTVLSGN